MLQKIIFTIYLFHLISFAFGQVDSVIEASESAEAELSVAINPTDTNNIVVATMNIILEDTIAIHKIYYTKDFGETWSVSNFTGLGEGDLLTSDPVLSFDKNGDLYLADLSIDSNKASTNLSKSMDGGETWEQVLSYGEFMDKPWIDIDNSDQSPHLGNKYVPVIEYFSTDTALVSFVELLTISQDNEIINKTGITGSDHLPCVALANDGDIYTSSINWDSGTAIRFHHFTDEGKILVSTTEVVQFPKVSATDISWRFQNAAYMAVDNSGGEYSGRIYLAYTAPEPSGESFFDVYLTYSDDRGLSWSEPKPVHQNLQEGVQQFYSSLYVNDNGVLIMDWYDRGAFGADQELTNFVMGISHDGGDNFEQLSLTSEPMDFNTIPTAAFNFGIGEYHQCVATNSTAISFWSDGRASDGLLNIYFAKVNIENIVAIEEYSQINTNISLSLPYPNPAQEYSTINASLSKTNKLRYLLHSNDGKLIKESSWKIYPPGAHQINIDCQYPAGLYTITMQSESGYFNATKLMIKE